VSSSEVDIAGKTEIPGNRKIEKRVWIKASAEIVYRALTNSRDLSKWFCDHADCTPCKGGDLIAFWKSDNTSQRGRAVFTEVVPNNFLELLWMEDGGDLLPSPPKHTLRYTIKSKSGMTEVVMEDDDETTLDEETFSFMDRGWNSVLLELKDFCERKERLLKMRSGHAKLPLE